MSFKCLCPALTRRSVIASFAALAAASGGGNHAAAQDETAGDLPDAADGIATAAPSPAPALRFTDAAGRKLSLAAYRGAGLVVNIWATWCGPCVAEFPTLAAAAPALAASKILVLPISIDFEGLKAVKPFYDTHGISTLPILLDPDGSATDVLNANGVPITIIINPAGQMVGQAEGAANWNTPRALRMLRHLAGQAPATAINPIQPV